MSLKINKKHMSFAFFQSVFCTKKSVKNGLALSMTVDGPDKLEQTSGHHYQCFSCPSRQLTNQFL